MSAIPRPTEPSPTANVVLSESELATNRHILDCYELIESHLPYNQQALVKEVIDNRALSRKYKESLINDIIDANERLAKKGVELHEVDTCNFGLPDYDDTHDIIIQSIPRIPDLVEGLITQGTLNSFIGKSKTYKSWNLARLALCIANGVPWLGMNTKQSKTLYINPELIPDMMKARLQMIAKEMDVSTPADWFKMISLHRAYISPDELLHSLESLIERDKFEVICFDSVYRLYGDKFDENSNADVCKFLLKLDKIAAKSKATIIFTHHASKGNQNNKEALDVSSGAGAWGRVVDTCITARVVDAEKQKYSLDFTFRYHKQKAPIGLFLNGAKCSIDTEFDSSELTENKYTTAQILNLMKDGYISAKELQKQVVAETGMSEKTFYRYWKAVKSMTGVSHNDKNEWTFNATVMPQNS